MTTTGDRRAIAAARGEPKMTADSRAGADASGGVVDIEAIRRQHWQDTSTDPPECDYDGSQWPCHTTLVLAENARLQVEVEMLRQLLWSEHGHDGLYGDDGELQCARCPLDFKRASWERIQERLVQQRLTRLSALDAANKRAQEAEMALEPMIAGYRLGSHDATMLEYMESRDWERFYVFIAGLAESAPGREGPK